MIVCDVCRDVKAKASDVKVQVVKTDAKTKTKPAKDRVTISIDMHVCEDCLDELHGRVGSCVREMKRQRDELSDVAKKVMDAVSVAAPLQETEKHLYSDLNRIDAPQSFNSVMQEIVNITRGNGS